MGDGEPFENLSGRMTSWTDTLIASLQLPGSELTGGARVMQETEREAVGIAQNRGDGSGPGLAALKVV